MAPLTASEALMASRIATAITVDLIAVSALSVRGRVGPWCREVLPLARPWEGPLTLSTTWGGQPFTAWPYAASWAGGPWQAATEGRHLAGSVNHGANMPAHGSSARSASAVYGKRSRICCLC